jgi:hypothetical protein
MSDAVKVLDLELIWDAFDFFGGRSVAAASAARVDIVRLRLLEEYSSGRLHLASRAPPGQEQGSSGSTYGDGDGDDETTIMSRSESGPRETTVMPRGNPCRVDEERGFGAMYGLT